MSFMKQMVAALMGAKPKIPVAKPSPEKENTTEGFCATTVASLQVGTHKKDTSPVKEKENKLRGPPITFY